MRQETEKCGLHEVSRFVAQKQPYYNTIIDETRKLGDIVMKDREGKERVERFVAGVYQIIKNLIESVWQPKAGSNAHPLFRGDNHLICLQALGENAVRFYAQYRQPGWTVKQGLEFVLTTLSEVFVNKCHMNAYKDFLDNISRESCTDAVHSVYSKVTAKDATWMNLSMKLGEMYKEVAGSCGLDKK